MTDAALDGALTASTRRNTVGQGALIENAPVPIVPFILENDPAGGGSVIGADRRAANSASPFGHVGRRHPFATVTAKSAAPVLPPIVARGEMAMLATIGAVKPERCLASVVAVPLHGPDRQD